MKILIVVASTFVLLLSGCETTSFTDPSPVGAYGIAHSVNCKSGHAGSAHCKH